uniref:NADH dehydrogenase subunit 4L n=1 Tax=Vignadula atrata TaxID=1289577 RepID=UPI001FA7231B|nr:NADH dehydrogenase subunit 4L [Vignadula atrata]ULT46706.1 NADH dehydrogenase subunit 4L [Vignadula atrata]
MMYWGLVMCLFGVVIVCLKSGHLLSIFVGVEMIALGFFVIICCVCAMNKFFLLLFVMTISVVEAAIMLSLLVMMVRVYGSDSCSSLMSDKS